MSEAGSIYVDFDDVLCQTAKAFLEVLARDFGRRVRLEEITSFDLAPLGLSDAELATFLAAAHRPEVLAVMEPVAGAVEVLRDWRRQGYELAVVTGRPPATAAATRRWLERAEMPFDTLTFVDKYGRDHGDGGNALPLATLADHRYRLAVEDSLVMARYLAEELEVDVALLDRPWNRSPGRSHLADHPRITRCRDWTEIAACLPQPQRHDPAK